MSKVLTRPGGLGRRPAVDERDKQHPMRGATRPLTMLPKSRYWQTGPVLDQGLTQHCVGFAWRQFLSSLPMRTKTGPVADDIYALALTLDEWPGEDDIGTSTRGGAKALRSLGHIKEFLWAYDEATLRKYVLGRGTVVFGTNWFSKMNEPDRRGFIAPEGDDEGGHAYLITAYSEPKQAYRIINSWGEEWGERGRAWIPRDAVAHLLTNNGEACSAIECLPGQP